MPLRLGSSAVSLRLGTQSVTGYLGSQLVTVGVPGAPTIVSAVEDASPLITLAAPSSDGGSPITGYVFYVNGVQVEAYPYLWPVFSLPVSEGDEIEAAAVNAVGEGPKSAAVTYPTA